jgi:putative transposase
VIPSEENRQWQRAYGKYRHYNLVERFFCRFKRFRRIATSYDKLVSRFSTFITNYIWLA